MFRSLKEKLKLFKKKATKELGSKGISGETVDNRDTDNTDNRIIPKGSEKVIKEQKPPTKSRQPVRKRSGLGRGQEMSLKRKIEKETSEETPWVKVETKPVLESGKVGWFAKSISEGKLDAILWDLEVALLESDVALPVVEKIKDSIKNELLGEKIKSGSDLDKIIEKALQNAVIHVLQSEMIHFDNYIKKCKKPVRLMFVGVNGTGKTSAIAKIVFRLKKENISCVIAASDTFRAGAIEQLELHANKLGVKLIKDKAGSDPAAIAFDSIEHAKARHKDVVLIDTAGRMQTNTNLMDEMRKIKRVAEPDMVIFVGDALAGNDVVEQASQFESVIGLDAAILTKLDADAKGGAALSIAYAVGKPILFICVGQRYGDLIPFNPQWLVKRLFE